jgi:hypothetical protein
MTKTAIRQIIREEAASVGTKFRITKSDEVHFFGDFPNAQGGGWYFVASTSEGFALQILRERSHEQMRKAGML